MSDFPRARVVADSTYADQPDCPGVRLTTMEVSLHRFVLAEFNTHRVFSRNSASSRAIPITRQLDRLANWPADPVVWPAEQKGMQGGFDFDEHDEAAARAIWQMAKDDAVQAATNLSIMGLHKSVTNRLLEPFMRHTVVVTSTAWENFFALRLDADAQPEIRMAAEAMKAAYDASTPIPLVIGGTGDGVGGWHTPYFDQSSDGDDVEQVMDWVDPSRPMQATEMMIKVSAARCARTSYLTQDGRRDLAEDVRLYDRLVTERVEKGLAIHWSPLEHVATPWPENRQSVGVSEGMVGRPYSPYLSFDGLDGNDYEVPTDHLPRVGNLLGWRSLRTTVEANHGVRTFV